MGGAPIETRDRAALERFLRRDAGGGAQVYALADLDEPFWSSARVFARVGEGGETRAVCIVLPALDPPIVYSVAPPGDDDTRALAAALAPLLPERFFASFALGVAAELAGAFEIAPHGEHVKMALADPLALEAADTVGVERLGPPSYDELREFYDRDAYRPAERGGRFFARYMLELGPWFGVREGGRLVSVAGLHVLSRRFGVAAIGNVATRPDRRGRGLGRAVTARLARELARDVPTIALNVAVDNAPARRCYSSLGFREVLRYEEAMFSRSGRLRA